MADYGEFPSSLRWPSNCSAPRNWTGPTRVAAIAAVAAFALAGCNANQTINASSSQRDLSEIYPNYSQYNPVEYAQTSGFYGGR